MLDWLKPDDMQRIVALLSEQFNYVLIDCPAGVEDGFKNAVAATEEAIVITTPEVSAVRDADRVIAIDSKGRIVDGDHILFLWGSELKEKK